MWALRILISVLVNIWIDNSDPSVVCISGNISKQLWQIKVTQIQYKRDHERDALNECQNNTTTTSYNNNDNNTNNKKKNNNISDWSWARHNKFYTHYGGSTVPEILLGYLPVLFSIGAWVISDFKLKVGSLLFPCHRQWITLYGCKHLNFSWTLWFRLCIWHPFSPLSSSQCDAHFLSHNLHLVFCDPFSTGIHMPVHMNLHTLHTCASIHASSCAILHLWLKNKNKIMGNTKRQTPCSGSCIVCGLLSQSLISCPCYERVW